MTAHRDTDARRLRDLDDHECRSLLGAHTRGRIAWNDAEQGPTVIPVNYLLVDEEIVVRTSVHTELARHFAEGPVALQIDEYDDEARTGWSVLARGRARSAQYVEVPTEPERPTAWVLGNRSFFIRISVHRLTGRQVLPT